MRPDQHLNHHFSQLKANSYRFDQVTSSKGFTTIGWLARMSVLVLMSAGLIGLIFASGWQASNLSSRDISQFDESSLLLQNGPWGRVSKTRLLIQPGNNLSLESGTQTSWYFTHYSHNELSETLAALKLPDATFSDLLNAIEPYPDGDGYRINPPRSVIRGLPSDSRAKLYRLLAAEEKNRHIVNAYRFWGDRIEDWLAGNELSPSGKAVLAPLIYQEGPILFFADLAAALPALSESDKATLATVLSRETTLRLTLHLPTVGSLDSIASYWGRGGREADVLAQLQALRSLGVTEVDVVDLLPPFARERLYTYATPSHASSGMRDCHWSALNFASNEPDDRYLDAEVVAQSLHAEFVPTDRPLLGDLVVFATSSEIFHTAVYIADDILFTKNGPRTSRPWMLMPMDAMTAFYPQNQPIHVTYLARRSPKPYRTNL